MPGGYGNITGAEGNTFSTDNQPANRGRKVKVFSEIARDFQKRGIEKATPQAVAEAYEYLLALPLLEVMDIAGSPKDANNDHPVLYRAAADELRGKRKLEILREMLDRAHGKATQKQEINGKLQIGNPAQPASPEQTAAILKVLNET